MNTPAEDHSERDYFITLGVFSLALVAFVVAHWEPAPSNRPLSAWLRDLEATEPYRRTTAEATVHRMGVRIVPALLARIESSNPAEQSRAVLGFEALGDEGRHALPSLMKLLEIERTSFPAARSIAAIGPVAVPILTNGLTSPVTFIRNNSARALGRLRTEGRVAVPALVRVLNDEDDDLRYFATRALGNLAAEPGQAVPALVDWLADPNVEVRRIAARSLGQFHGHASGAVPALRRALKKDEESVKLTAAFALQKIHPTIMRDGATPSHTSSTTAPFP